MEMPELPELQGSSPQEVAWAREIRINMIQTMLLYKRQYIAAHKLDRAEVLALGLERLLSQENQASWWIDRRLYDYRAWATITEKLVSENEANRIYHRIYREVYRKKKQT